MVAAVPGVVRTVDGQCGRPAMPAWHHEILTPQVGISWYSLSGRAEPRCPLGGHPHRYRLFKSPHDRRSAGTAGAATFQICPEPLRLDEK